MYCAFSSDREGIWLVTRSLSSIIRNITAMSEIPAIIVYILLFISLYFEVFLLITFLEYRPKLHIYRRRIPTYFPSVTIIVPCYNEEGTVKDTILSILKLNYPKDKLHIIAVNDGSTDNTARVLAHFGVHPQVTILHKENGGKHTALNYALKQITSELVGCLDADSFVDKEALTEIIKYFTDKNIMAVVPAINVYEPKSLLQKIQKAEYELSIFIRRTLTFLDSLFVVPGPFSIFRTSVFKHIGNYKKAYSTEDLEIALRMQSRHYRIENAHTAYVYTVVPNTLKGLFRQRLRWTYGFLKNVFDYRFLFFKKQYGNLGFLVLPTVTLSIFGALFLAGLLIVNLASQAVTKIVEMQAVGLGLTTIPTFEWFYVNTHSIPFLIYTIIILTMVLIIVGRKLSTVKRIWSADLFYYLFIYGFLVPSWLAVAVYNVARTKESSWTAEKSIR